MQIQSAILAMQSFAQHAIIVSQPFKNIAEKTLAVVENVKNQAEAIRNLYKKEKATLTKSENCFQNNFEDY